MTAYKLCTGQLLYLLSSPEDDVVGADVRVEAQDPVRLADFVHDNAVKWKNGEISVFIELLGLLFSQLWDAAQSVPDSTRGRCRPSSPHVAAVGLQAHNQELVHESDLEDRIDLDVDYEEDEISDEDYDPFGGNGRETALSPTSTISSPAKKRVPKGEILDEEDTEAENILDVKREEDTDIKRESEEDDDEKVDNELENSRNQDEETRELRCPDCKDSFQTEDELKVHFQQNHTDENRFRCHLCGLRFKKVYNLKCHVDNIHRKKRNFQCTECEYTATKRSHVRRHLQSMHAEVEANSFRETEKTCELCNQSFITQKKFQDHVHQVHGEVLRYGCTLCSEQFEEKQLIKEHISTVHGEEEESAGQNLDQFISVRSDDIVLLRSLKNPGDRVACDQCDSTFSSIGSLRTHQRTIHQNIKDYVCKLCHSEFGSASAVKKHLQSVHNRSPSKDKYLKRSGKEKRNRSASDSLAACLQCGAQFQGGCEELVNHVIAVHPTQPDLFPPALLSHGPLPWTRSEAWEGEHWVCPLCPQHMTFRTESLNGMVSHVKLSHGKLIMCWVCGFAVSHLEGKSMYEHMKSAHPLKAVFACDKCGVYNQSKKFLGNHRKIHRMEELQGPLLSCDTCDYVTQRPDLLSKHRSSHKSSKKFMCGDCGKVLSSRSALNTHSKLHSEVKNNQCTICFKSFSQRGYLITHMNAHSDSKPYSCEFCAMTFYGPTNLSQHRKRSHGDLIGESPRLACDLCPKRFWIPSELKYHRERVHEGKKDFSCVECQKRFADKKNLKKHLVNVHKVMMHYPV